MVRYLFIFGTALSAGIIVLDRERIHIVNADYLILGANNMNEIIDRLQTQPLAPVYLIHGADRYRQHEVYKALYQRAISEGLPDWNWINIEVDKQLELRNIIDELKTAPWGGGTKIVAVTDAEQIPINLLDKLVNWLEENHKVNCLALFFLKLDRRRRSIKKLMSLSFEIKCDNLQGEALVRWVNDYLSLENKKISRTTVMEFLARTGNDLNLVKNELDKLVLYALDKKTISKSDVEAVTAIAPGQLEQGAVFNMAEAIAAKNTSLALDILHQLLDEQEPALRILPLIDRQLRLVLAAKSRGSLSISNAAKVMGESQDFALKQAQKYQGNFTLDQLYQGLKAVIITDSELKFGADPRQALEYLIIRLCEQSCCAT